MKNYRYWLLLMSVWTGLSGCAATTQSAPCPQFGAYCKKIPVNSWNYL